MKSPKEEKVKKKKKVEETMVVNFSDLMVNYILTYPKTSMNFK